MKALSVLAAMNECRSITHMRRGPMVWKREDFTRLGLHIPAMDMEQDNFEYGTICTTCCGSALVTDALCANDPHAKERRCEDCEEGIVWKSSY